MSGLPPKADIRPRDQDVGFGPKADIRSAEDPINFTKKQETFPPSFLNHQTEKYRSNKRHRAASRRAAASIASPAFLPTE